MGISVCGLGRASRLAAVGAAAVFAAVLYAVAQEQQPSSPNAEIQSSAVAQDSGEAADFAEGLRLLEGVRDNVFSFDDPTFYWFCRYVRERPGTLDAATNGAPLSWRFLAERPSDYRGRVILVEGILQSHQTYEVSNRPGVGVLHQCELSDPTTRGICTVVVVDDPGEVPLRSFVRASGHFIKIRAYKTTTGETGAGPLLVARTLSPVPSQPQGRSGPQPSSSPPPSGRCSWVAWGSALLAVIWLALLRRGRRLPHHNAASRRQSPGDHTAESNCDFDWLPPADHDHRGS